MTNDADDDRESHAGLHLSEYLIFAFGSVLLVIPSAFFSLVMLNPVTWLFALPFLPVVAHWRGDELTSTKVLEAMFWMSVLGPLTLAPLHWLNYRRLEGNAWGYVALLVVTNLFIAFLSLTSP